MDPKKPQKADGKAGDGQALAEAPRSVQIAFRGIRDDQDAAEYLSALIGDIMTSTVPIRAANTGVNAMGKLLKLVEMRQKYGDPEKPRSLPLLPRVEEKNKKREDLLRQLKELEEASDEVVA